MDVCNKTNVHPLDYFGVTVHTEANPYPTARLFDKQFGRPIITIEQRTSTVPYLHLIQERTFATVGYKFSMNIPGVNKKNDNRMKFFLGDGSLVQKQSDMQTYIFTDIHSEEELFQFSTLYDVDYSKIDLIDKVQKELNKLDTNNDYIISGSVSALELIFKE